MAKIKLADIETRAPEKYEKGETKEKTAKILEELKELQNVLYAESKNAILVVIQGIDASGKDGLIRNVFGALNPQGVSVTSFKAPTERELSHDFLWRIHAEAPAKGFIKLFNRSHYEDVIVTRVHKLCDDRIAKRRIEAINNFERLLVENNNTHILKFYLHVSHEEQLKRLDERIHNPQKQWKYNEKDFDEAKLWDVYMEMYEDCFENCNEFPWTIVPADQNWYKEYMVASNLCELLKSLDMKYPSLNKQKKSIIAG